MAAASKTSFSAADVLEAQALNAFDGYGLLHESDARMVLAISIDGGPITQEEKKTIPRLMKGSLADAFRFGYPWASDVYMLWAHFPDVWSFFRSMCGVRNLIHDPTLPRRCQRDGWNTNTTWTVGAPPKPRSNTASLLTIGPKDLEGLDESYFEKFYASNLKDSFFAACAENDPETVEYCLSRYPELATSTIDEEESGITFPPIHYSLYGGEHDDNLNQTLALLLKHGADINQKDSNGMNAIEYLEEEWGGYTGAAELLSKHAATLE